MSAIRRTDQGGSIVTFIIVGVILAVGLIGTVYILKKHGEQVRKDQAIAAANQQKTSNPPIESGNTKNSGAVSSNDGKAANSSTVTTNASQNLPTTGFELPISGLVGSCLLTVAITSYSSSRRSLIRRL